MDLGRRPRPRGQMAKLGGTGTRIKVAHLAITWHMRPTDEVEGARGVNVLTRPL
jgi:hypothetical protein